MLSYPWLLNTPLGHPQNVGQWSCLVSSEPQSTTVKRDKVLNPTRERLVVAVDTECTCPSESGLLLSPPPYNPLPAGPALALPWPSASFSFLRPPLPPSWAVPGGIHWSLRVLSMRALASRDVWQRPPGKWQQEKGRAQSCGL